MQSIYSRNALLFVYGTLMRPFKNEYAVFLQKHSLSIHKAVFQGQMYLIKSAGTFQYPAVIESSNPEDKVFGELYRLREPQKVFDTLDIYEGCATTSKVPHEYKRIMVSVQKPGGQIMQAYTYLYCQSLADAMRICSGDFLAFSLKPRKPSPNTCGDTSGDA